MKLDKNLKTLKSNIFYLLQGVVGERGPKGEQVGPVGVVQNAV